MTEPNDHSSEIEYRGRDCFKVKSMNGDWIEIESQDRCDDDESKSNALKKPGWIKWKDGDKWIINLIHEGILPEGAPVGYPAHLHIDLLPIGQKGGWGRKLMEQFWGQLRSMGVPAVHLGVGKANANAVGFYQHIGYHIVEEGEFGFVLGKQLR